MEEEKRKGLGGGLEWAGNPAVRGRRSTGGSGAREMKLLVAARKLLKAKAGVGERLGVWGDVA